MAVIVVGEALSKQGTGLPLTGPSGDLLASLCGVSTARLRQIFKLHNLCAGYKWNVFLAEMEAARLALSMREGDIAVLLGRKVESMFAKYRQQWFMPWDIGRCPATFYTTPHPSGLNRWWNDHDNRYFAATWWEEVTKWAQSGPSSMTPSLPLPTQKLRRSS